MIKNILLDRFNSIEGLEKELEMSKEKVVAFLKSDDKEDVKKVEGFTKFIAEIELFISNYKHELNVFIEDYQSIDKDKGVSFSTYEEKFKEKDNQFFAFISEFIEKRDGILK